MWLTRNRKIGLKYIYIWTGIIAFCIAFTLVYYRFSHQIKSNYLTFLWLPGTILLLIYFFLLVIGNFDIGEYGIFCLNAGVGTLLVYQILRGIYEIALILPENSIDVRLTVILLVLSIVMMTLGVIISFIKIYKK